MKNALRNGIYTLLLSIILITACYWWVDKSITFWVYSHHVYSFLIFKWLTHIPEIFIALTISIYPVLVIRFCYGKWSYKDQVILAACNSLAIAYFIRGPMKFVFARYWPATWVNSNLSLLRDNAYGFNWFHRGVAYESFPSGHETATVAVMAILWIAYPKLRWLAFLISFAVAIGLIGMNYHFISDVIAGGVLGGLTAYYTTIISGLNPRVKKGK